MRPDSYRSQSPDAWEAYVEEGGNQNNNHFSIRDNALAIVALVFAALALGAVVMKSIEDPQIIDSKIAASAAQIHAAVAGPIADAQATAQAGKEHARIALDEVQRSNAQLEARGLLKHQAH